MTIRELIDHIYSKTKLNRGLKILLMVNTILVFSTGLFAPFYVLFVEKIGGGIALAGLSWGLFSVVTGVLILIFSDWGLKVQRQERLVALGYTIRAVVFLSYAFMDNIPQLIMTQVLWGIGTAVGAPAFDVLYSKHTDNEGSLWQWGQYEGIASIAIGISALIGGLVIAGLGYQMLFIIMAIICLILGMYIWRLPKEVL
jgi:predicted MFS family arabinose efflux permease